MVEPIVMSIDNFLVFVCWLLVVASLVWYVTWIIKFLLIHVVLDGLNLVY